MTQTGYMKTALPASHWVREPGSWRRGDSTAGRSTPLSAQRSPAIQSVVLCTGRRGQILIGEEEEDEEEENDQEQGDYNDEEEQEDEGEDDDQEPLQVKPIFRAGRQT